MDILFYKDRHGKKAAEMMLRNSSKRVQYLAVHYIQRYALCEYREDVPWCRHLIGALCALRIDRALMLYCARTEQGMVLFDGAVLRDKTQTRRARRRTFRNYYHILRKEDLYGRKQKSIQGKDRL